MREGIEIIPSYIRINICDMIFKIFMRCKTEMVFQNNKALYVHIKCACGSLIAINKNCKNAIYELNTMEVLLIAIPKFKSVHIFDQ